MKKLRSYYGLAAQQQAEDHAARVGGLAILLVRGVWSVYR